MLSDNPLVSCVMPTKDRRRFVAAAIDCWLKQAYQNRELVIVDDGMDPIGDLIPQAGNIRYFREPYPPKRSTGSKRNFTNSLSAGEVICHWDDDDWSAADRIEDQMRRLRESGKSVTGYGTLLFWDTMKLHARRYHSSNPGYVCGTTLCYTRELWLKHQFVNKQVASDNDFVFPILKQIAVSHDVTHMVARIHDSHTSKKGNISQIVPDDLIPAAFWENEKLRLL